MPESPPASPLVPGAEPSLLDLRLVPASVTLWVLALVGIASDLHATVLLLAGLLAAVVLVRVLVGTTRRERPTAGPVVGHVALVLCGAALLLPGVHRHDVSRDAMDTAARTGARATVEVVTLSDAQAPQGAPAWARDDLTATARTVPGMMEVGRERIPSPALIRVLLRGPAGTGGAAPGQDPTAAGGLGGVRDGSRLRVTGTVRVEGTLVLVRVDRVETIAPAAGVRTLLRDTARDATSHLPPDEAALVRGMTTGDTAGLSGTAEDQLRRAGISHLVAVSGANIALVLAAVLLPLLVLGVPRRPRLLVAAAVAGGYVALVGEEPSVQRAAMMAAPLLAARFLGRRPRPVTALAATVAIWACASPQTVASFGFVLSALATGAILVLAPRVAAVLREVSGDRIGTVPALVVAVPLVAQLVCTPVLVLLDPSISAWAVAVNLVVAPLVAPITVVGLVAVVVGPVVPAAARALDTAAGGGAHLVLLVAGTADALPGSRIDVPGGAVGGLLAAAVVVLVGVATVLRHRRIVRWSVALVLVAMLAPPIAARVPGGTDAGEWTVAACAVGQGDAFVLRGAPRGPDGTRDVVVLDTGPDPDALTSCLDTLRVEHVSLLVLTHPHADHIGGVDALVGSRRPVEQWICPSEGAARARAVPSGPAPVPVVRGHAIELSGLRLDVLWPESADAAARVAALEDSGDEEAGANDCSVVVAVSWDDGTRLVALGDLEPAAQRALSRLDVGHADIVKVAHHGSRRQDAGLYAGIRPRLALIGVGAQNSFGHPAPAALGILEGLDARVLRTDRDGTVVLTPARPGTTGDEARSVSGPR